MEAHQDSKDYVRPFDAIMLDVGDGHWLYVEQVGRRDGIPAIFLHGGPGSGAQHAHRTLFDPDSFHAILYDQRGAGRSHPYLATNANTTQHLVADIERIRAHFGIEKWFVVGGSWGSTLAVAYAEAHPERVAGLVIRAVFLGTRAEFQWAFVDAPKIFRPELYQSVIRLLPASEQADPLASYLARLTSSERAIQVPAAHVWNLYERALAELNPDRMTLPPELNLDGDIAGRIPPTPVMEAHYMRHDFFLAPDQLVREAGRLKDIPGVIVQGRYDLLCPPRAAYALHAAWPASRLVFMEQAGHAMTEPGVIDEMRAALGRLAGLSR